MTHKYKKHKITKHRTMSIPDGFEFVEVEKDSHQPNMLKIVFKKKYDDYMVKKKKGYNYGAQTKIQNGR